MELRRKDISLLPTQHGFLFLGILIAMLLGSVNYNNNAGFILVFLLGSMALISLALSYRNLLGLSVVPGHAQPVFAGQTGVFPVTVTAQDTRGQALYLYLAGTTPGQAVSLTGTGVLTADLPVSSGTRGIHTPEAILVESVFPFGLFRLRASFPNGEGLLVYPAPAPGPAGTDHAGARLDGEEESRLRGPDDFQGLAPYVPGSPVNHISWKALSRGKGLFIKDFTAETGQDLEHRLSVLCRALLEAESRSLRYGLRLGDHRDIRPETGRAHLHGCLEALALYGGDS